MIGVPDAAVSTPVSIVTRSDGINLIPRGRPKTELVNLPDEPGRGPRHQVVARLGKLDGTEQKAVRSWHNLDALPEGRPLPQQLEFGDQDTQPLWRQVDLEGVRVERVRRFDRVYLGLALWRRLRS